MKNSFQKWLDEELIDWGKFLTIPNYKRCIDCEHYRKPICRFVDTPKSYIEKPTRFNKCFVFTRKGGGK